MLTDITDELKKVDPAAASNPLINPPQSVLDKVKQWPPLTDEQVKEFTDAYLSVTGS